MTLSSGYLDAFFEVARLGSFSNAAKHLHITQSAISQRIQNLEEDLGTKVFVRQSSGIALTEFGQELLRFCNSKQALEEELLARLADDRQLVGTLRIGGYSTVVRSLVMPILDKVLKVYPQVRLELINREIYELPNLLRNGSVDFIFLNYELPENALASQCIGFEQNVLIESAERPTNPNIFFDHDPGDQTTELFWRQQKTRPSILHRSYLDEIYAILDAVRLGWGRAVVPRHLIQGAVDLRVVDGLRAMEVPIFVHYYNEDCFPKIQQVFIAHLKALDPKNKH